MDFLKKKLTKLDIDFVGLRYIAGAVSTLMVLAAWVSFFAIGPNFGIDFTGGTEIHLKFQDDVQISEVRSALESLGLDSDAVQQMGAAEAHEFKIRIQDPEYGAREVREKVETELKAQYGDEWIEKTDFNAEIGARLTVTYKGDAVNPAEVRKKLANLEVANVSSGREENQVVITLPGLAQQIQENIQGALGDRRFEVLAIDAVGPAVGAELQRQGFISIAATLGLVLLYVAFRFDIGFAPGAIVALFHDVSVTVGIFVVAQLEFNLPMIGALLTIVGYSLNDTIVIYDRIRENRDRFRRKDTAELINLSINETLARTLATSVTTLLAICAFLFLGGPVIFNFALAMLLGIIFGTYSTMFVASPMILLMEDLKPHLAGLLAVQGAEDDDPDDADDGTSEDLSQSELRRRARQAKD